MANLLRIFSEANRRTLLKKITKAAMKANLELGTQDDKFKTWDVVLNDLCWLDIDSYDFLWTLKQISEYSSNAKMKSVLTERYLDNVMG